MTAETATMSDDNLVGDLQRLRTLVKQASTLAHNMETCPAMVRPHLADRLSAKVQEINGLLDEIDAYMQIEGIPAE